MRRAAQPPRHVPDASWIRVLRSGAPHIRRLPTFRLLLQVRSLLWEVSGYCSRLPHNLSSLQHFCGRKLSQNNVSMQFIEL